MEIVQINIEPRVDLGKKATKSIRGAGKIPAILYSKKNGVSHFTTTHKDVKSIVYTPDFKLAELNLNGKVYKALLKEIVFHPVTDAIEHMDFLELVEGQPLKAEIPVQFKGVSPGVKNGGKLIKSLRTVQVKTTPDALVDTLYVSIDDLELGSAVRVKDIETPEGIEILVEGAIPVASVVIPRVLKTEEEEAAELAELTEVEGDTEDTDESVAE